ncbi:bifunctional 2-polyprenyl-6-hydroxyphenol methylase/3-demethylubiquinol 3-O-methyltransferase UbiG [Erwinia sp. B116]|uniref:class I SAM-dependent methyltransferase n=1 Tax=Erwinia sp. B116 TaxID=1561024 RepID=UPI000C75F7E0|nr:class I SAM-dependent methyltransferase [Erwinia sp. B116]PLV48298.1 tellurite resistance protein [Erwinia sp. B116]
MSIDYYQRHAQRFFDDTVNVDMSALYQPFLALLPAGGCILDAGCGSGRDAQAFHQLGYQVDAFDASSEMVARATALSGLPVQCLRFEQLTAVEQYDGIWCCASLLHVPADELSGVMAILARALKPSGVWYLSFKLGSGEREVDGRSFTDLDQSRIETLLAELPQLSLASCWQTADNRPVNATQWLNAIVTRQR